MQGYWNRQISRRRAMAGTAALGAAVAVLASCGGGESDSSGRGGALKVSERKDTTGQAVPGGIYGSFLAADVASMDTLAQANTTTQSFGSYIYSRLFKWKPGIVKPSTGEIEGDLVESWEMSGDATQLTLKIRPNALTDPRPPLNGRTITSEDVKFSFDKFLRLSSYAPNIFNAKNSSAPLQDVQTPDARTVVLKLAFPYAAIFDSLAEHLGFWVMPVESEGKFDPRSQAHGSGPWMLKSYERSVGVELVRNPNWYLKGKPFLDGISQPIIPEYSNRLSQFKAGRIWGGVVREEDIPATLRDHPTLLLFQGEFGASSPHLYFGWNGPYKDVRLRRAVSLLIDRELFAETFGAAKALSEAGLTKEFTYNSHLGVGWGPFWVNPTGKGLGEAAKYFKKDIAEAKKLVTAAGYPSGIDSTFYTLQQQTYGTQWHNQMEALLQMLAEGGLRFKTSLEDYASVYIPKYHYSRGDFDGMSASPGGVRSDPGQFLQIFYHTEGSATRTPKGQDSKIDGLIDRQLRELDREKRISLTHDIQKHLAENQNAVAYGFQSQDFSLTWPWVGNAGAYRGWVVGSPATETTPFLWFDASKKTA